MPRVQRDFDEIDRGRSGIERDRKIVGRKTMEAGMPESSAKGMDNLAQRGACLAFFDLAPKQANEPLARLASKWREREVSNQRLRLAAGQDNFALIERHGETAERPNAQARRLAVVRHVCKLRIGGHGPSPMARVRDLPRLRVRAVRCERERSPQMPARAPRSRSA